MDISLEDIEYAMDQVSSASNDIFFDKSHLQVQHIEQFITYLLKRKKITYSDIQKDKLKHHLIAHIKAETQEPSKGDNLEIHSLFNTDIKA